MSDKPLLDPQELRAYLLLYCAHADFVTGKEEKEFILSKVEKDVLLSVYDVFQASNDYQDIQRITDSIDALGYGQAEIETLEREMKELLNSDGVFDTLEKNLFMGLSRLLRGSAKG